MGKQKAVLSLMAAFIFLFFLAAPVRGAEITVQLNGSALSLPVAAELDAATQRPVVPMRAVFEAMGFAISTDSAKNSVTAADHANRIQIHYGGPKALVNGAKMILGVLPYQKNGTTYVPLTAVSFAGATTTWTVATSTITIQYPAEADLPGGEKTFVGTATDKFLTGSVMYYLGDGVSWYRGGLSSGYFNGQGKFVADSGASYNGTWQQGKMSGPGRYYLPITKGMSHLFEGSFSNGELSEGTVTYPDGSKYSGGWKDGRPFGQGTYTYPDGSSVSGNWSEYGSLSLTNAVIKK